MSSFVYMMASRKNGTLYVGVTFDLYTRALEHKEKLYPNSFTARHGIYTLVWYRLFDNIEDAIAHEKHLKRWNRAWKINLIEADNLEWNDLHHLL